MLMPRPPHSTVVAALAPVPGSLIPQLSASRANTTTPKTQPARSMPSSSFKSTVIITHISTATAVLSIDGVNFLLDPAFDKAGDFVVVPPGQDGAEPIVLTKTENPALALDQLPVIDAVLLSHEDHIDNLDISGRTLLNGRHVLTTLDGAKNLAPRPGVQGLAPWQSTTLQLQGRHFTFTATPTQHLPGGECTGFVIESASFGVNASDGKPNVIYISGDTVYIPELAEELPKKYHIVLAVLNLGKAVGPSPNGPVQITMGGEQAARLTREIGAEKMVPLHFESWKHFTQLGDETRAEINTDPLVKDKVVWVEPGKETQLL